METDLTKFMDHITLINKDISKYEDDEKGVVFYCNTVQLLTKVENLELSKEEYQVKKFEQAIDDLEYNIEEVERPQSKYAITKKEEDRYTIVNSRVKVRQVYNVSNAIGIHKSFINKDEALAYADEINKKVVPFFE
jgi:hypothetical protein